MVRRSCVDRFMEGSGTASRHGTLIGFDFGPAAFNCCDLQEVSFGLD